MPDWRPTETPLPLSTPATGEELVDWLRTVTVILGAPYGKAELAADLARLGYTVTVRTLSNVTRYGGELPRDLHEGLAVVSLFLTVTGARPPARDGNTSDG
jgi:hypothetical protein